MISFSIFTAFPLFVSCLIQSIVEAQMLGTWSSTHGALQQRQNNKPDTSAFNIVNGRIFTPGLGIILAVGQPSRNLSPKLTRIQAPALYT
ncbi:hypothetical protein Ptr902_06724 [Pyrenophora tritici-repentis]|nr:hypothetical protein Ptr902_06724 [Pyrenophora tritici-repentis]